MKKSSERGGRSAFLPLAVLALALFGFGCSLFDFEKPPTPVGPLLYAVDSKSGNVYEIALGSGSASLFPLVSTQQDSSGEIQTSSARAYVAVGSYSNTAPGLYVFDPAKPAAGCSRIGAKISAQYICIASATLGYVSSSDYMGSYENALYSFNPSDPAAGLSKVLDLAKPQEVIQGGDGNLYAAENGNGKVARIDAAGSGIVSEIPATAGGTTGLLAGSYKGEPGVFVANLGDWSTGSIDFIANSGTTALALVAGPVVSRLAALTPDILVATGGYPARTWLIDISQTPPAATEVTKGDASSFGGGDIEVIGDRVCVPDGSNRVYVFGGDGVVSSIKVGQSGALITNIGLAE